MGAPLLGRKIKAGAWSPVLQSVSKDVAFGLGCPRGDMRGSCEFDHPVHIYL